MPLNADFVAKEKLINSGFIVTFNIPAYPDTIQVGMSKITGLNSKSQIIEYREGDEIEINHKFRGNAVFDNVSMERAVPRKGVLNAGFFKKWKEDSNRFTNIKHGGNPNSAIVPAQYRGTAIVEVLDVDRANLAYEFELPNVWPAEVSWSDLEGAGGALFTETILFATEAVFATLSK